MRLFQNTIWICIILLSALSAQSIYYKADFNKMIARYGKDEIRLILPPKQIRDSLQATPFTWMDGFRIQVFAGQNRENALSIAEKLKHAVTDSVYLIRDNALFRVQFGDYTDRIVAETKVDSMRKWGWPEAWIATRKVKKYIYNVIKTVQEEQQLRDFSEASTFYSVQIAACGTMRSAEKVLVNVKTIFPETYIIKIGGLFKILIGKYDQKSEAEGVLERARNAGFNDAWITGNP